MDIVGLQRTKRVCNGYSWSLMDNSGSVQDIVVFFMDIVDL